MADSTLEPAQPPKIYHLRSITARIKQILLDATTKRFWVQAHLVSNKSGVGSGHFYCELVETDDQGRQVAKINAVIWKSSLEAINRKLHVAGCEDALCCVSRPSGLFCASSRHFSPCRPGLGDLSRGFSASSAFESRCLPRISQAARPPTTDGSRFHTAKLS